VFAVAHAEPSASAVTDEDALVTGLHHVQVSCPAGSEDALRAFYGGVLGMAEVAKPPALAVRGGVWFRAGGCELHCGVEEGFTPARKAHPGIAVSDVDAVAARVRAAGGPVRWDDQIPGLRRFHTDDPVGNRVELQQG
jgi:catechol 2,3-dioxygenase-like lactoylglutathione lyase family enzyme